jgi:Rps23 Pro-64 3,4-dihydroxylase Tpa1-like proline 4-hydroxylase
MAERPCEKLADFLKRYNKSPQKSYSDSSESDGEITDPYEMDYCAISSDNRSEVSDDTGEKPTRFDPLVDTTNVSLDKSKEKHARKYFTTHVAEDIIQSEILKSAPISVNTFLYLPAADDYIEDMVNDPNAMIFLRIQDHSIMHIQKKLSQVMGSLSKLWSEVDSNDFIQTNTQ